MGRKQVISKDLFTEVNLIPEIRRVFPDISAAELRQICETLIAGYCKFLCNWVEKAFLDSSGTLILSINKFANYFMLEKTLARELLSIIVKEDKFFFKVDPSEVDQHFETIRINRDYYRSVLLDKLESSEKKSFSAVFNLIKDPDRFLQRIIIREQQIIRLDLSNQYLNVLPREFLRLSALEELNLNNNRLTTLPDYLFELVTLEKLILAKNQLTILPEKIGKLVHLKELDLSYNKLSSLPESLGELSLLEFLDLSYNSSLVKLPSSLKNILSFQRVTLPALTNESPAFSEAFADPNKVYTRGTILIREAETYRIITKQLKSLPQIELKDGHISKIWIREKIHEIPPSIENLVALEEFHVEWGNVETIPDTIKMLSNLKVLVLRRNQKLQVLPESLGNLTSLETLDLVSSDIREIPDWLIRLKNLKELNIYGNESLKRVTENIIHLPKLQKLNCQLDQINAFTSALDGVLVKIGKDDLVVSDARLLTRLTNNIKLYSSKFPYKKFIFPTFAKQIEGGRVVSVTIKNYSMQSVPKEIYSFTELKHLDLSDNRITNISDNISQLKYLENLILNSNEISAFPESLTQLKALKNVEIKNNRFLVIPESILSNEVTVTTGWDMIEGLLETEIKALDQLLRLVKRKINYKKQVVIYNPTDWAPLSLRNLDLSKQNFDTIPDVIKEFRNLQSLNLSYNRITELSDILLQLTSLRYLDLSHNRLKNLPEDIDHLKTLEFLFLNNNLLEELPKSFCNLRHVIHRVNLIKNKFSRIPECLFLMHIERLEIDNQLRREWKFHKDLIPKEAEILTEISRLGDNFHDKRVAIDNRTVIKLDLSGMKLKELPESVGELSSLRTLNLARNNFSFVGETLPEILGRLKSLKWLDISSYSSTPFQSIWILPESMIDLQELKVKSGHDCFLPIKEHLVLSKLRDGFKSARVYDIRWRKKNGYGIQPKHKESCIGHVRELNASNSGLKTLPDNIKDLKYLKRLDLSKNQLSKLPKVIGNLKELNYLNLQENPIAELPDQLFELEDLVELNISHMRLRILPELIRKLSDLTALKVDNNLLTSLPEAIGSLHKLWTLSLSGNLLKSLPEGFKKLESRGVFISGVSSVLTSTIVPEEKEVLLELEHHLGTVLPQKKTNTLLVFGFYEENNHILSLGLCHQNLKKLPPSIWKLQELQRLNIQGTNIITLPQSILKLQKLRELNIHGTKIKEFPTGLDNLHSLEKLYIDPSFENYEKLPKNIIQAIFQALVGYDPLDTVALIEKIVSQNSEILFSILDDITQLDKIANAVCGIYLGETSDKSKLLERLIPSGRGFSRTLIEVICVKWLSILENLSYEDQWEEEEKFEKSIIIDELTIYHYDLNDKEEFLECFDIVQSLIQDFLLNKEYIDCTLIEVLEETLGNIQQGFGRFSEDVDQKMSQFLNEISTLELPANVWANLPWSLSTILPSEENSPKFFLASLIKSNCRMCGHSFESKKRAQKCESCSEWVCCGFAIIQKRNKSVERICYGCVETRIKEVLNSFSDLEVYQEGSNSFMSSYSSWIRSDNLWDYMNDLLRLFDESIISIKNVEVDERWDGSSSITRRFSSGHTRYRKLLYAWLNRRKGSPLSIKGMMIDGRPFKRTLMNTILHLNIEEPLCELDLSSLRRCTKLKSLRINVGELTSLDFSSVFDIEILTLHSGTKLKNLDLARRGLAKLKELNIYGTTLENFEIRLQGLNLESLFLSRNCLSEIDLTPLTKQKCLHTINLASNNLQSITIPPLKYLKQLILDKNKLETIDLTSLEECHSLNLLSLTNNSIKEILLPKSLSVTEIKLQGNNLNTFDCTQLDSYRNLKKLNLQDNPLASVDLQPLIDCRELESVLVPVSTERNYPKVFPTVYQGETIGKWILDLLHKEGVTIRHLDKEDDFDYPDRPHDPNYDMSTLDKGGIGQADLNFWSISGTTPNWLKEYHLKRNGLYFIQKKGDYSLNVFDDGEWTQENDRY